MDAKIKPIIRRVLAQKASLESMQELNRVTAKPEKLSRSTPNPQSI
ncbi:hypothetical protein AB0756_39705 [Tolypothrix campylonemoides VB511288_2]|uniref:Uncharacterized protein n=1 Tax=Tolypothrix campylonemoides VB511288_2 TaxID=3232311 RepID=A0ABW8XPP7_9CYAN